MRETRALLRAMGTVIKRAEDLGEDDIVDIMAMLKLNIARRTSLQVERERLRAQTERRFRRRPAKRKGLLGKKRQASGRRTLYLVDDTSRES